MPRFRRTRVALPLLFLASAPLWGQTSVTLNPVADTCLWEFDPNFNFGRQRHLPAGSIGTMAGANGDRSRALYRYDLAGALPAGAVVESARMVLSVTRQRPAGANTSDFALSRILVSWEEGNRFGSNPGGRLALTLAESREEDMLNGEATWINRVHDTDPMVAVPWSSPGGVFGIDFADTQAAMVPNVDSNRSGPTSYNFDFTPTGIAELQQMIDGTLPNFGWVLYALDEETRKTVRQWTSRESRPTSSIEGPPPEFTITYALAPPPPVITSITRDPIAGTVVVRLDGTAGRRYELQTSDDLVMWSPGEIQTPAIDSELVFTLPVTDPTTFVRVESTPAP